ncbi:tetratricopeptide repeat-containing serine protease family protein [Roseomonas sp. GCM10028921]
MEWEVGKMVADWPPYAREQYASVTLGNHGMRLLLLVVCGLGLVSGQAFSQGSQRRQPSVLPAPQRLEFHSLSDFGGLEIRLGSRVVRRLPEMSGGQIMASYPRTGPEPRVHVVGLYSGGNACFANPVAILDLRRSPPYLSDTFADCSVDLVLMGEGQIVVSSRHSSAEVDRVWTYAHGGKPTPLPRLARPAHLRRAEAAWAEGNHAAAIPHLATLASRDEPAAKYLLGVALEEGKGVAHDLAAARTIQASAADLAYLPSMYRLAVMLAEGIGGGSDSAAAVRWLRRAASAGYMPAQRRLAIAFLEGKGIPADLVEAMTWWKIATRPQNGAVSEAAQDPPPETITRFAEAVEQLAPERAEEIERRVAAFVPRPAFAWSFPDDWSLWDGKHPLHRVRGSTFFGMPGVRERIIEAAGPDALAFLERLSGPGGISREGEWEIAQTCRAHGCDLDFALVAVHRVSLDVLMCRGSVGRDLRQPPTLTWSGTERTTVVRHDTLRRGCGSDLRQLMAALPPPARTVSLEDERQDAQPREVIASAQPGTPGAGGPGTARQGNGATPSGAARRNATAFRIGTGLYITSLRAVEGCPSPSLQSGGERREARIMQQDAGSDLALLGSDLATPQMVALRAEPPRLAEPVVAVGYPSSTLVGSQPLVSIGHVSALTGLRDDTRSMTVSSSVQSTSGGPIMDGWGTLLGVIPAIPGPSNGSVPVREPLANAGFAIKASVVRDFLETYRVEVPRSSAPQGEALGNEAVARRGAEAVALLACGP